MDKQKVYDECMGYAKEFVYTLNSNDPIVLLDPARHVPYAIYDKLRRFISLSINSKCDIIALWNLQRQPRNSSLCSRLMPLLDEYKDSKNYQHIVRIIFCMIRNGIYSKNEFIDALKDTTNIPALLEIIKYDDFTVMTDNHRFDV